MCRALKVLCAAPDPARLSELKLASVAAHWELVGGAASVHELQRQVAELGPDVVVVDAGLGQEAIRCVRSCRPTARLVTLGPLRGADAEAAHPGDVRAAILGLPRPGGPVRI